VKATDIKCTKYNCCRELLEGEIAAMQAKIDRLMLEYCPEEMTPEQTAEWDKSSRTPTHRNLVIMSTPQEGK